MFVASDMRALPILICLKLKFSACTVGFLLFLLLGFFWGGDPHEFSGEAFPLHPKLRPRQKSFLALYPCRIFFFFADEDKL